MHSESYDEMKRLFCAHADRKKMLHVLDVGSCDVNGCYKPIFEFQDYVGIDIAPGPNVDKVVDAYKWDIDSEYFDVVISGQAFEHIEYFWLTWAEMVRVTKPGGLIFLIAPGSGGQEFEHRHPVDCWRFMIDGFIALAKLHELDVLEINYLKSRWNDVAGAFRKGL
jgi:SAM-dependent methyltransferase